MPYIKYKLMYQKALHNSLLYFTRGFAAQNNVGGFYIAGVR